MEDQWTIFELFLSDGKGPVKLPFALCLYVIRSVCQYAI